MENTRRRKVVPKKAIERAIRKLTAKLYGRLNEKGRGTFTSTHEMLGVMTEEQYELTGAVQSNLPTEVENELLDVGVTALFGLACMEAKTIDW
jgi:hypothetical protein